MIVWQSMHVRKRNNNISLRIQMCALRADRRSYSMPDRTRLRVSGVISR